MSTDIQEALEKILDPSTYKPEWPYGEPDPAMFEGEGSYVFREDMPPKWEPPFPAEPKSTGFKLWSTPVFQSAALEPGTVVIKKIDSAQFEKDFIESKRLIREACLDAWSMNPWSRFR